ncbi:AAA family ATPase [Mucilaginibacter phyllosphaerae]|uniref:ATPase n=1 Tax=Mucilaginibacter phyllosphaerae TaxID=1812349 RepID=A0ABR6IE44_9SPHI|nr:AAA family ATPase [Mucilaginibacter phyllosphaerae]MBB3971336.1 putative ATPase [Mucilaginibacter phyllosphaerae]GGH24023.1 hypothetical protein GCM10007352_38290 [Mucilaginibacter phyllosphaerae]
MPSLSSISLPALQDGGYLQHIPSLNRGLQLALKSNVTFFMGENGSGKSTLLEGIAEKCGFNIRGGNRNHNHNTGHRFNGYQSDLAPYINLAWSPQGNRRFFYAGGEFF